MGESLVSRAPSEANQQLTLNIVIHGSSDAHFDFTHHLTKIRVDDFGILKDNIAVELSLRQKISDLVGILGIIRSFGDPAFEVSLT
jgi:hypothetical protein